MEALFWVAVVAVFASAAALMMLACAGVGVALRTAHQTVMSTCWFGLVRRHGLWGAVRVFVRIVRRRGLLWAWPRTRRDWEPIAITIFVPVFGFMVAAFLPGMAPYLVVPNSAISRKLAHVLTTTSIVDGVVGALTATYVWVRGLSYIARPSISRKGYLPELWFPPGFSRRSREHLTLNIYWHYRIGAAILFAMAYPLWFLGVLLSGTPSSSSTASATSAPPPLLLILLGVAILLLLVAPGAIPALMAAIPIQRRLVSAKLAREICELLKVTERGDPAREAGYPGLIDDPLGRRRWELAQIAGHLADTAWQLDAHQPRGLPPHPLATLLRGASATVRQFLGSEHSLKGLIPDDLIEMLKTSLALFAAHHDQAVYQHLAKQVAAFDQRGDPTVQPTDKLPGKLATLASRTAAGIPKMAAVITTIAIAVAIIAAVILALLHRMNSNDLLHYLR